MTAAVTEHVHALLANGATADEFPLIHYFRVCVRSKNNPSLTGREPFTTPAARVSKRKAILRSPQYSSKRSEVAEVRFFQINKAKGVAVAIAALALIGAAGRRGRT